MNNLQPNKDSLKLKSSSILLLFYAIGSVIIIPLVGQLTLSEVIVALSIPFLQYKKLINEYTILKPLVIGSLALLAGQIISDIINRSALKDFSRGTALILISFFSTIFLVSQLSKNKPNILYYIFFIFIIQLFFGYDGGGFDIVETGDNYFKFRFAPALNMITMLLSCLFYKRNRNIHAVLILFLNAIISILFAARSNGLIFLIAGFGLFFKIKSKHINARKIIGYAFLSIILLYLGYIVYANQVVYHDFGGINSKNQFALMRNIYNPFELLIYGRTDFFVTLQAIFNRPIIGYGSWAKDPGGYYTNLLNVLSGGLINVDTGYIPIHSIFLGTWATAGIIGLIATLYIFVSLFKKAFSIYKMKKFVEHLPLIIVLTIDMLWAFLFSPLSLLRSSFPLFAAIIIIEYRELVKVKETNINPNNVVR